MSNLSFDVDYVFPYVNNTDLIWQKNYFKYLKFSNGKTEIANINSNRYFDYNTLKYLFRGIEQNMPWIRKIFLIVERESQIPKWLNTEKVNIVYHEDIIPKELLPTYNSSTIEMFIGNIQGLSEYFIYGNDDIFPLNPMKKSDFFNKEGLPKLKMRTIPYKIDKNMYLYEIKNGELISRQDLNLKDNPEFTILNNHSLTPMRKSTVNYLYNKYNKEIMSSCTPFRYKINLDQNLYNTWQFLSKQYDNKYTLNVKYYSLEEKNLENIINDINTKQLICINDCRYTKNKNIVIDKIIQELKIKLPNKSIYENDYKEETPKAFLMHTPASGNIGDQLISLIEKQLLDKHNISFVEITDREIFDNDDLSYYHITDNQVIFIHGGGYIGGMWQGEMRVRQIINEFPNNKIVILPQSIYFDFSKEKDKEIFNLTKSTFSSHKNLTVFVREENSYSFMKEYMPDVNTYLIPDSAMLYNNTAKKEKRQYITFLFRKDKEKSLQFNTQYNIIKTIQEKMDNLEIIQSDTVAKPVQLFDQETNVENKLLECRKSKLVITDRLHGMIFSMITNTPCIAFNNSTGKVKAVYDKWIRNTTNSEYIKFVNNEEEFNVELQNLNIEKEYIYDNKNIEELFDILNNQLLEIGGC